MALATQVTRGGTPVPPVEIADEVESYARVWGRHGSLHYVPTIIAQDGRVIRGTWVIRLTLKEDDARMLLWQEQRTGEMPTEDIWLHVQNPRAGQEVPNSFGLREPPYLPIDIIQWGAANVRAYLEEGNMWSGKARANSPLEELTQDQDKRKNASQKRQTQIREDAGKIAKDHQRSLLGTAFVSVKNALTKKPTRRRTISTASKE